MVICKRLPRLVLALAALAPAACDTPVSATDLHPEGPPMIQQIFMREPNATGRVETVLAFGTHADVPVERTRPVTQAAPFRQTMRVVIDELLIGNYLEEIQCAPETGDPGDPTDCPEYSRVPEGTTPEDIARCADPATLAETCTGPHAVCLNPAGDPCGIRDEDTAARPADGAPDNLRFIAGAVTLRCGSIVVGMDPQASFWQPSGNQLVPAGMTPDMSIGPALILVPRDGGAVPASQTGCKLVFAANVVDKDHTKICTPAGGTLDGACTPGDVSGFSFDTEAVKLTSTTPSRDETGVALSKTVFLRFNAAIDVADLPTRITLTEGTTIRRNVVVARQTTDPTIIQIGLPDDADMDTDLEAMPLLPDTTYRVDAEVQDIFGVPAPAPFTFTFTTGPAA